MKTKVLIATGTNRVKGIHTLLKQFDLSGFAGKSTALKANYNSADPFPASTHPDTIRALVTGLKDAGVTEITLAERSGMGNTSGVLKSCGVPKLAEKLGFNILILNDLPLAGWKHFTPEGSHWRRGFLFAKPFLDAENVVQTCCLKTHRFGGHITMSLKNSVGMIARYDPNDGYDYMGELHNSEHQRKMVAEINTVYKPALILMDAIKAFVKGGPAHGELVSPNLLLAGTDRVAMDAIGTALLRHYGTTPEVNKGKILHQEQLARAVELGLGVQSSKDIHIVTLDEKSKTVAIQVERLLKNE